MPDLTTLAAVKLAIFPTGATDTNDDTILTSYLTALTQEVQEYTHRQFITDAAPTVYLFDVEDHGPARSVYVPKGVQSVASLGFATASQPDDGSGTYTTVTAANVLLRPRVQDRRPGFPADTIQVSDLDLTTRFYPGFNTIKVTMTCGFAAVPADIERLAVAVIVRRWQARKGGQADIIGASDFGGPMLRFTSGEERELLDRYSDPQIG